jgi:hypothetical protein
MFLAREYLRGGSATQQSTDKSREPAIDTFYEPIFMKFSGNAHNTMPYMQVTFLRRSLNSGARGTRPKYMVARIDNVND